MGKQHFYGNFSGGEVWINNVDSEYFGYRLRKGEFFLFDKKHQCSRSGTL